MFDLRAPSGRIIVMVDGTAPLPDVDADWLAGLAGRLRDRLAAITPMAVRNRYAQEQAVAGPQGSGDRAA